MQPFAALFDRRRQPLERADIARLEGALGVERGRGSAPRAGLSESSFVLLGACEPGDRHGGHPPGSEPLASDQKASLGGALGLDPSRCSGARILAMAYRRWGPALWSRIRGPFGLVLHEPDDHELVIACDPLLRRPLFFFEQGDLVVVASEIETLLRWPKTNWKLDPVQLARFFAFEAPSVGATHFAGIGQVEMGTALSFRADGVEEYRFWDPATIRNAERHSDSERAEEFLERLVRSVSRCLGEPGELGIMLSGGLDSTSLAVLAAIESSHRGFEVAAASWVFEDLASCDERIWMAHTLGRHEFEVIRIEGDGLWPLGDKDRFSTLRGSPEENPYRSLRQSLYDECKRRGRKRLWHGGPADFLQRGGNRYLRDLLLERRFGTAGDCLRRQLSTSGPRSALAAVARVFRPGGRRSKKVPAWLTLEAIRLQESQPIHRANPSPGSRDTWKYLRSQARSQALEAQLCRRFGLDVASPYWTRDFVEFMLSLPAHAVFRPGTTKFVAREAMRGLVPEPIRLRQTPTLLDPLFNRGMFERERDFVRNLLFRSGSLWDRFVDRDTLTRIGPESAPAHRALLWRCASFELWRSKHGWELA